MNCVTAEGLLGAGAVGVIQGSRHIDHHIYWPPSWILPKIINYQKTAEIDIF